MSSFFEQRFAIAGVWLYPPDNYQEEAVPVVGYTLDGTPVRQGFPAITFTWSFLKQEHMTALMAAFKPAQPRQVVTFIDKATGALVNKWGMLHEPVVGARQIIYYNNVALKVTRIEDWAP